MVFRGHIKDGRVVTDEAVDLPNGTKVNIEPRARTAKRVSKKRSPATTSKRAKPKARKRVAKKKSLYDALKPFIGIATDLPPDAALNHDHYLYGAPKK